MAARFFSPYYLVNVGLLLAYIPLRLQYVTPDSGLFQLDPMLGFTREQTIFLSLGLLLSMKFKRAFSLDGFLPNVFMFGKCAVAVALWSHSADLAIYYTVVVLVLSFVGFALFPQPHYNGPQKVKYFRDEDLASLKTSGRWLVEFYTTWATPCVDMFPVFAELSMRYSSSNVKFGKVDLGVLPLAGEEFIIDTSTSSKQLPTLILFEKGREVRRLPAVVDGKVIEGRLTKQNIIDYFELEKISNSNEPLLKGEDAGEGVAAGGARKRRK